MRPSQLILKCFAETDQNGWYAICLDLNLFAQADTYIAARKKLHNMIFEYVRDAYTVDKKYFSDLIPRRAPLIFFLKYYFASIPWLYKMLKHRPSLLFTENMPLEPKLNGAF